MAGLFDQRRSNFMDPVYQDKLIRTQMGLPAEGVGAAGFVQPMPSGEILPRAWEETGIPSLGRAGGAFGAGEYGMGVLHSGLGALGVLGMAPGVGKATRPVREAAEGLATDYASRMARAKEMGFRLDEPIYHGMGGPLEGRGFDLARGGQTTQNPVGRLGVSLADDPALAGEFAHRSARRRHEVSLADEEMVSGDTINLVSSDGANIVPGVYRADKLGKLEVDGSLSSEQIAGAVLDAWDAGFDAIRFKNYTTPGGQTGQSFVLVKDPSQIRSPHAMFDPAKRQSPDILASAAGAGLAGTGLMAGYSERR
jgi:hypothetical protein